MAYPTTIDAFTTHANSVDIIYAEHINDIQTAVVNIETEMGASPSVAISLGDDAATSLTPGKTQGVIILYPRDDTAGVGAMLAYKVGAGCFLRNGSVLAADTEITTGVLAGTTGTDVKVTVSVHTDGKIYIENRLGSTKLFGLARLGQ